MIHPPDEPTRLGEGGDNAIAWAVGITADYSRFAAASAMLETTDRLTDEMVDPNQRGFLMLVGALRAMAEGRIAPPLVLDSFLLRTLAVSGWAPELRVCASCGADGPHHAFDVRAGGLVCTACRRPGAIAVRQSTIEHMIFLLAGDWENVTDAEETVPVTCVFAAAELGPASKEDLRFSVVPRDSFGRAGKALQS